MAQGFGAEYEPMREDVHAADFSLQDDVERELADPTNHWGNALHRPDREEIFEAMKARPLREIMGLEIEDINEP